jgi:hypothetical protein
MMPERSKLRGTSLSDRVRERIQRMSSRAFSGDEAEMAVKTASKRCSGEDGQVFGGAKPAIPTTPIIKKKT